ncbi:hypothetical protein D1816_15405 [Aquimarina sp. AD10]|uniref:nuclear transport factor 2 family protein n=1 Tax=Aquimarina sp. AD10 TaxID=1714849 RepID=UPI000E4D3071|nr:nuclear transport factor 2 family protein [Aquimarina sp. AD10]AXT61682.1 hypothetical protein D1816_15405 [Aquimarina sp. AD10]RKN00969.1 hypothetical protein D7033_06360 [Aquimarina sp. AD10]
MRKINTYFWISALVLNSSFLIAQSDKDQINTTINKYIEGTSYNKPETIKEAFYEEANLFLSRKDNSLWIVPVKDYAAGYEKKEKGKFNGRTGKIIAVDIENDIATAKAEILISKLDLRFMDIFLLKKIEGNWKIISKAATRKK